MRRGWRSVVLLRVMFQLPHQMDGGLPGLRPRRGSRPGPGCRGRGQGGVRGLAAQHHSDEGPGSLSSRRQGLHGPGQCDVRGWEQWQSSVPGLHEQSRLRARPSPTLRLPPLSPRPRATLPHSGSLGPPPGSLSCYNLSIKLLQTFPIVQ